MSSVVSPISRRPGDAARQSIACALRPKELIGRGGPVPHSGEVEITNLSAEPLEIEYRLSPLQYLELLVTDTKGRVVSDGHFSDRFSPALEPSVIRLLPGESFTAPVPLLATFPRDRRAPGTYSVRAIYEYAGTRATSAPVAVQIATES